MKIQDIAPKAQTAAELITVLKRRKDTPDIDKYKKQMDPMQHKIQSRLTSDDWPDKQVKDAEGNYKYTHRVTRISVAMQKLIVKRSTSFTFGNDPVLTCETENDQESLVFKAVKRIHDDAKCFAINRQVMRAVCSYKEAAECWFSVEKPGFTKYGFKTDRKLRVQVFSADKGDTLYPKFDRTGDMIAFSRGYQVTNDDDKTIEYFETYTDEEKVVWSQNGSVWTEESREDNPIGMIPIVYARQQEVEWADVQTEIERLESLLSQFAETNRYFSAPKIVINGKVVGWAKAGTVGEVLEMTGENAEAKYLTWDQAPEAVKLEIESLFNIIYSVTQTPDISFNNVKGIGALSGIALKLMFLDAHLKVMDKKEIYIPYLQRRISINCGYIGQLNTVLKKAADSVSIMPEITPYMIIDELAEAQTLTMLTGSKPVLSQKTAIGKTDMVDDTDAEYNQLQEEAKQAQERSVFEPTA